MTNRIAIKAAAMATWLSGFARCWVIRRSLSCLQRLQGGRTLGAGIEIIDQEVVRESYVGVWSNCVNKGDQALRQLEDSSSRYADAERMS